jgi:hypothetical protein
MNPVIETLLLAACALFLVIGAVVSGIGSVAFFVLIAAACWVAAHI